MSVFNITKFEDKFQNQPEFVQAVREVYESVKDKIGQDTHYSKHKIFERIIEPDRVIKFRVSWIDDNNQIQVNTGYRVQYNNAIGPYKGGLRFHPTVNESILKFLGFEQIFKNALTGLPLGGAKGGSDFDPKDKSDNEMMRFSQAFMSELYKYIGPDLDVPAGDIGVGAREIGYLFGYYKKLKTNYEGVLTGKGLDYGGSLIRTEATGYGAVYFLNQMLEHRNDELEGKRVLISGSGNVALYAAEKAIQLGAKVVTMSDSGGTIVAENGITEEQLKFIKTLKEVERGRIKEAAKKFDFDYLDKKNPWSVGADIALPCATQNEITKEDATQLASNGIKYVAEGANMPSSDKAVETFKKNNIVFAPGKASNAGGVAVSGLEMSQNSLGLSWSREDVDQKLKDIMKNIHLQCLSHGEEKDKVDYAKGANVAGFIKVADAMIAQGIT